MKNSCKSSHFKTFWIIFSIIIFKKLKMSFYSKNDSKILQKCDIILFQNHKFFCSYHYLTFLLSLLFFTKNFVLTIFLFFMKDFFINKIYTAFAKWSLLIILILQCMNKNMARLFIHIVLQIIIWFLYHFIRLVQRSLLSKIVNKNFFSLFIYSQKNCEYKWLNSEI